MAKTSLFISLFVTLDVPPWNEDGLIFSSSFCWICD